MVGNTNVYRPRFLWVQKGPNLVENILSNRCDPVGVNHRDGLANVTSLHGLNNEVCMGRLIGLRGIASRKFPPDSEEVPGLPGWSKGPKVTNIDVMVSIVKVFG